MKTKPKKKTVTAWAFAWQGRDSGTWYPFAGKTRSFAINRRSDFATDHVVGPIAKIELPLPKERSR